MRSQITEVLYNQRKRKKFAIKVFFLPQDIRKHFLHFQFAKIRNFKDFETYNQRDQKI